MKNAPYEYSNKVYNQIKAGKPIRQIDRSRIQDAIIHIKRAIEMLTLHESLAHCPNCNKKVSVEEIENNHQNGIQL